MRKSSKKRVPVNIIAGPLGVGKTTTINHLMAQRPAHERWAVLVNEYGLIGLDAALMEGSQSASGPQGVEIREVAGGCICCSAGFMFEASLVLLLQRRPDRLLIEPTGLAALSGILDTLDRKGIREAVDLRSVLCLLDPSELEKAIERDEVRDQVEAADLLLANRSDLADSGALDRFDRWARELFPPKSHIAHLEQGRLEVEFLDLISNRQSPPRRAGHIHEFGSEHGHADHQGHGHAHSHEHEHGPAAQDALQRGHSHGHERGEPLLCDEGHPIVQRTHKAANACTVGWLCWSGLRFDLDRASAWLHSLFGLPGARRIKAVLRTDVGWCSFNYAAGVEELRPSAYRRDSRIELVLVDSELPDARQLDQGLRACLVEPPQGDGSSSSGPDSS